MEVDRVWQASFYFRLLPRRVFRLSYLFPCPLSAIPEAPSVLSMALQVTKAKKLLRIEFLVQPAGHLLRKRPAYPPHLMDAMDITKADKEAKNKDDKLLKCVTVNKQLLILTLIRRPEEKEELEKQSRSLTPAFYLRIFSIKVPIFVPNEAKIGSTSTKPSKLVFALGLHWFWIR